MVIAYYKVSWEKGRKELFFCGRLLHKPSGRTYHEEFNPPKVPMKDDVSLSKFGITTHHNVAR